MNRDDRFLLHRARNLAIHLEEKPDWPMAAGLVTELIERLEKAIPVEPSIDTVTIEKEVFKNLFETAALFSFWVDNIGRLSFISESPDNGRSFKFRFVLNPPGRRSQFLREDVIQALVEVREVLKAPHYG